MEATTLAEALRRQRTALGGSATTRAATTLNAVQASKRSDAEADPPEIRGRLPAPTQVKRNPAYPTHHQAARRPAQVVAAAHKSPSADLVIASGTQGHRAGDRRLPLGLRAGRGRRGQHLPLGRRYRGRSRRPGGEGSPCGGRAAAP